MDDQLIHVYPEQFPKETLVKKLEQFGLGVSVLQKIEGNIHEVVKCFFDNIASLPRRNARENRRGQFLSKIHVKEDKKLLHINKLSTLHPSPVRSTTSTPLTHSRSIPPSNSTPEMDRLQARSKAAQHSKTNSSKLKTHPPTRVTKGPPAKRLKTSGNNNFVTKTVTLSQDSTSATISSNAKAADPVHKDPVHKDPVHKDQVHKDPVHKDPVHKDQVHKDQVHKDQVHKDPVHKDQVHKDPVHKDPVHKDPVHKDQVHKEQVHKDQVHKDPVKTLRDGNNLTLDSAKGKRRKLKRNMFPPPPIPACKISKS